MNINIKQSIAACLPDATHFKDKELRGLIETILSYCLDESHTDHHSVPKICGIEFARRIGQEILCTINGKMTLEPDERDYIHFLEQEGIVYSCSFLEVANSPTHLDWSSADADESILQGLRRDQPKGIPNTCCYDCGMILERHPGDKKHPHLCSKRENRTCFFDRKKQLTQEKSEWEYLAGKQACKHCGKNVRYSADERLNNFREHELFCQRRTFIADSINMNCKSAYLRKQSRLRRSK